MLLLLLLTRPLMWDKWVQIRRCLLPAKSTPVVPCPLYGTHQRTYGTYALTYELHHSGYAWTEINPAWRIHILSFTSGDCVWKSLSLFYLLLFPPHCQHAWKFFTLRLPAAAKMYLVQLFNLQTYHFFLAMFAEFLPPAHLRLLKPFIILKSLPAA